MRAILAATAFGLMSALAAPALAQSAEAYSGTWAFQTASYGDERVGAIMSGVAVVTPATRDRYDIRLVANERLVNRDTGQSVFLTARQSCSGENDNGQFTITCRLDEPLDGYEPDSFILQQGEVDQLIGVVNSAISGQVTFTRLR